MGEHGVSLENMGNMETIENMEKRKKNQTDDSKVSRRLLKEKNKLSCVDV